MQTILGVFMAAFLPMRSWLGQGSGGGGRKKWSHSRCIWKREPTGFACNLEMCSVRKSQVNYDPQHLDLNPWKHGGAIHGDREEQIRHQWARTYQEGSLGHIKFELPVDP